MNHSLFQDYMPLRAKDFIHPLIMQLKCFHEKLGCEIVDSVEIYVMIVRNDSFILNLITNVNGCQIFE
jgi:hypothetical protein